MLEQSVDVSVFVAPGAHLKLSSPLVCNSSITVTVASSGGRATLDGEGSSRIFEITGNCACS